MQTKTLKNNWKPNSLCKKELKFIPETGEYIPYTFDDFYPPIGHLVTDEVKKMCNRCPVKKECLEHALYHEKYGYWGGTSENERIEMRRKRGIKYNAPQSHMYG